jgi:hypothetical protein
MPKGSPPALFPETLLSAARFGANWLWPAGAPSD